MATLIERLAYLAAEKRSYAYSAMGGYNPMGGMPGGYNPNMYGGQNVYADPRFAADAANASVHGGPRANMMLAGMNPMMFGGMGMGGMGMGGMGMGGMGMGGYGMGGRGGMPGSSFEFQGPFGQVIRAGPGPLADPMAAGLYGQAGLTRAQEARLRAQDPGVQQQQNVINTLLGQAAAPQQMKDIRESAQYALQTQGKTQEDLILEGHRKALAALKQQQETNRIERQKSIDTIAAAMSTPTERARLIQLSDTGNTTASAILARQAISAGAVPDRNGNIQIPTVTPSGLFGGRTMGLAGLWANVGAATGEWQKVREALGAEGAMKELEAKHKELEAPLHTAVAQQATSLEGYRTQQREHAAAAAKREAEQHSLDMIAAKENIERRNKLQAPALTTTTESGNVGIGNIKTPPVGTTPPPVPTSTIPPPHPPSGAMPPATPMPFAKPGNSFSASIMDHLVAYARQRLTKSAQQPEPTLQEISTWMTSQPGRRYPDPGFAEWQQQRRQQTLPGTAKPMGDPSLREISGWMTSQPGRRYPDPGFAEWQRQQRAPGAAKPAPTITDRPRVSVGPYASRPAPTFAPPPGTAKPAPTQPMAAGAAKPGLQAPVVAKGPGLLKQSADPVYGSEFLLKTDRTGEILPSQAEFNATQQRGREGSGLWRSGTTMLNQAQPAQPQGREGSGLWRSGTTMLNQAQPGSAGHGARQGSLLQQRTMEKMPPPAIGGTAKPAPTSTGGSAKPIEPLGTVKQGSVAERLAANKAWLVKVAAEPALKPMVAPKPLPTQVAAAPAKPVAPTPLQPQTQPPAAPAYDYTPKVPPGAEQSFVGGYKDFLQAQQWRHSQGSGRKPLTYDEYRGMFPNQATMTGTTASPQTLDYHAKLNMAWEAEKRRRAAAQTQTVQQPAQQQAQGDDWASEYARHKATRGTYPGWQDAVSSWGALQNQNPRMLPLEAYKSHPQREALTNELKRLAAARAAGKPMDFTNYNRMVGPR